MRLMSRDKLYSDRQSLQNDNHQTNVGTCHVSNGLQDKVLEAIEGHIFSSQGFLLRCSNNPQQRLVMHRHANIMVNLEQMSTHVGHKSYRQAPWLNDRSP